MLKKLILENWKSFRYAELPIDPLTVLIGTNASGKSNVLDALDFLSRIGQGQSIRASLAGGTSHASIRVVREWAALKPNTQFTLKALIQGQSEDIDYLHQITVETGQKVQLLKESLTEINPSGTEKSTEQSLLFYLLGPPADAIMITGDRHYDNLPEEDFPGDILFSDRSFSQLRYITNLRSEAYPGTKTAARSAALVLKTLDNIYVFNPIPANMRNSTLLSDILLNDASNVAGVLAALPDERKNYVELTISSYVAHLPEKDIQKVWAERVGRLGSDAMLYCEEAWVAGEPPVIMDARGMSDGTLRFIAILTALLTRPEGSQLVIEEVDAGLHPSRAELLLKMLREIGEKRKIDILVTTHNPALLNALEPEMLPFIIVAHRDSQTGESKLTPLDNLQNLAKLLAGGQIGDLASRGAIEKSLSKQ